MEEGFTALIITIAIGAGVFISALIENIDEFCLPFQFVLNLLLILAYIVCGLLYMPVYLVYVLISKLCGLFVCNNVNSFIRCNSQFRQHPFLTFFKFIIVIGKDFDNLSEREEIFINACDDFFGGINETSAD